MRQADIDEGHAPGVSTSEAARLRELEQEVRELRRANGSLKRAASFFGAEPDRRHQVVTFIDANRDELGVEPICAVLQMAPSTYYAAKARQPCARAQRDAVLAPRLRELWQDNYQVYGARKLWRAAQRAGLDVGPAQQREAADRLDQALRW